MPKVSIIIPVYNTEKYLRKCLDSVCNQTLSDIEIICIDDCSPDKSLDILKKYAAKDKRIKLIEFKENKGVSIARNTGIEFATGEYIGFVDSDDFIDLDFYEKLYNRAIQTSADCAKGNIYDYNMETKESILTAFYNQNDKIRSNKAYFCYGFTSAIYRKEVVKDNNIYFPENITYFEDPYFSILMNIFANKVILVDDAKYNYIRHKESACFNCKNFKQIYALNSSICLIINSINKFNIPQYEYSIYISFLIEQIVPWCSDLALNDKYNIEAIKTLNYILNNLKYDLQEILQLYFLNKKKILRDTDMQNKKEIIKMLRKRIQTS